MTTWKPPKKLSQAKCEKALAIVAKWLATKGYGVPICRSDGSQLDSCLRHPDGTDCQVVEFAPAPTGPHAAAQGIGPMLKMDWDWPGEPTPTILLEGGPYDWAISIGSAAFALEGIFAEPYAGYALCLYPA